MAGPGSSEVTSRLDERLFSDRIIPYQSSYLHKTAHVTI